jgi:hypothetical protein
MADHSITASDVKPKSGAEYVLAQGIAGGTITAGQPLYQDATDSGDLKAAVNSAAATAAVVGIALSNAADQQPVRYLVRGSLTVTGNLTVARAYYVSPNPGGICLEADVASADFATVLGVATNATTLEVNIQASGVSVA